MVNKDDLVNLLSQKCYLNKDETQKIIDSLFDIIVDQLAKGEDVKIAGFGRFNLKERKEKQVYNPVTKTKNNVLSHKVIDFKESKRVKEQIN